MPENVPQVVLDVGAILAAVLTILAVIWWLVWPRVQDAIERIVSDVTRTNTQTIAQQLDGDKPDTVARHAKVAATAATEIPAMRDQLEQIASRQNELDEWQYSTDRRLGLLEEALVALLTDDLRARIFDRQSRDRDRH